MGNEVCTGLGFMIGYYLKILVYERLDYSFFLFQLFILIFGFGSFLYESSVEVLLWMPIPC